MNDFMFEVYDEDDELFARGEAANEQQCFNEGMNYLVQGGEGYSLRLWASLGEVKLIEDEDND